MSEVSDNIPDRRKRESALRLGARKKAYATGSVLVITVILKFRSDVQQIR